MPVGPLPQLSLPHINLSSQSEWWSQSPSSWSWWRWAMPSGRGHHDLLHPQPSTWPQLLLQVWNISKIIVNQFSFYFLSIALPYVHCSFLVTSVLKRYRTISDPCIDNLQGSTDNLQEPDIRWNDRLYWFDPDKCGCWVKTFLMWRMEILMEMMLAVAVREAAKKKTGFFWEISPKYGWVGWLTPKQGPNPSKPPQIAPKIAFFDPNFTFRSPKSHKNPGIGGWVRGCSHITSAKIPKP